MRISYLLFIIVVLFTTFIATTPKVTFAATNPYMFDCVDKGNNNVLGCNTGTTLQDANTPVKIRFGFNSGDPYAGGAADFGTYNLAIIKCDPGNSAQGCDAGQGTVIRGWFDQRVVTDSSGVGGSFYDPPSTDTYNFGIYQLDVCDGVGCQDPQAAFRFIRKGCDISWSAPSVVATNSNFQVTVTKGSQGSTFGWMDVGWRGSWTSSWTTTGITQGSGTYQFNVFAGTQANATHTLYFGDNVAGNNVFESSYKNQCASTFTFTVKDPVDIGGWMTNSTSGGGINGQTVTVYNSRTNSTTTTTTTSPTGAYTVSNFILDGDGYAVRPPSTAPSGYTGSPTYKRGTAVVTNFESQVANGSPDCRTNCNFEYAPSVVAPSVTTDATEDITRTSATFKGNITTDGGGAITDRGFYYTAALTAPGSNATGTKISEGGTATGTYSKNQGSLTNSTKYWVQAYATNSSGSGYGSWVNFTTLAPEPVLPIVTTNAATSIEQFSATINSSINPKGSATTSWFRYGLSNVACDSLTTRIPSTGGTNMGSGTTAAGDSRGLTGLSAGTTYYFCAIADNDAGTTDGIVLPFLTKPDVTLSANPVSITSGGSTTLTWTVIGTATGCTVANSGGSTITSGSWSGTLSGSDVTAGSHTRSITMTSSTSDSKTFTIYCSNGSGDSLTRTAVVSVAPAGTPAGPTVSNTPSCVSGSSYTATLAWTGTGYATGSCGTGFWVDIDNDNNWGNGYYHACISDPTRSTVAPSGFGAFNGATGTLTLQPGVTYYARTYNGTQSAVTPFGSIPACSCSLSANPDSGIGAFSSTITATYNMASAPGTVTIACDTGTNVIASSCTGLTGSCTASCGYPPVSSNTTYTPSATIAGTICSPATITDLPAGSPTCSLSANPASGVGPFSSNISVSYANLTSNAPSSITVNCGPTGVSGIASGCSVATNGSCINAASCAYPVSPPTNYTATVSVGGANCNTTITDNAGGGSSTGAWIQTVGGDVHSNTYINTPGGP